MKYRRSADKHGVPRRSSWYVVMTTIPIALVTNRGENGRLHVGADERGIELEVITVSQNGVEYVIHSMPTAHRHAHGSAK